MSIERLLCLKNVLQKGRQIHAFLAGDLLRLTSFLHKVFPKSDAALKVGCVLE